MPRQSNLGSSNACCKVSLPLRNNCTTRQAIWLLRQRVDGPEIGLQQRGAASEGTCGNNTTKGTTRRGGGTYADRRQARDQALRILLDTDMKREDFVEYDEYIDGTEGPFGPDVIVHAVKEGGENVLVSVITDH
ncbi:hypothetical protein DM02DRAFT_656882 [Periconia macrospinosa]|uniref:Uncharacterized protein n=1 Tax=Periconia macrospinosa TaxID=97972 RepID=A0A2V1DL56_9PLEO|nr:hypothetical protein DM02DRAFT_656882 [Periconia macrospinosa]